MGFGIFLSNYKGNEVITRNEPAQQSGPISENIDSTKFGAAWPFSVPSGELTCQAAAITFTSNGVTYPVNGTAQNLGLRTRIEDIWLPDPQIKGARISISPIIEEGQKLCR